MYPLVIVMLPLVGGVLSYGIGRINRRLRDLFIFAITLAVLMMVLPLISSLSDGRVVTYSFPLLLPPFGLSFRLDALSVVLATITSSIWLLVTVYSFEYMKHSHHGNRYHAFTLITLAGTLGTLLSGDLLTLFLFFELMSLASFVLVIHDGSTKAMRAGQLYLLMTIAGGLALFFGIIAVFELMGTVAFSDIGSLESTSFLSLAAFLSFLVGFGMKAGMFPVHVWLPEAHPVAPSPSSALLSGVMLKVGAFGLLRVMYNVYNLSFLGDVGWNRILLVISGITIILGSVFAIMQQDIKRRLAYSSIGQMGYILLGMSLLSENALIGDIFHIFAHAIMKSCLFLAAGAMIMRSGKQDLRDLSGIGLRMPFTLGAFTMASLALIGIPPFSGFLSKYFLSLGCLEQGAPFYVLILLISSLLSSVYYLPIVIGAFFKPETVDFSQVKEVPWRMLVPILLLALGTVIFNSIPANIPLELSRLTAELLFRGGGPL